MSVDLSRTASPGGNDSFRILALSGGGYRGLFTACVLEQLEARAGVPVRSLFNLIAGTSIGGILALALAAGIPAATIRKEIEARGPSIFDTAWFRRGRKPRFRNPFAPLLATKFTSAGLEGAVDAVLGTEWKDHSLRDLEHPVLIMAVSHSRARPIPFRSYSVDAATESLREVALATSAAPGFFPPRDTASGLLVDGGIIANAPDLQALADAMGHFGADMARTHVLSIGTAAPGEAGPASDVKVSGHAGWIVRRRLVQIMMEAQERMAVANATSVLGSRFLRIDSQPAPAQAAALGLDSATPTATQILKDLADEAWKAVRTNDAERLTGFCRHRRPAWT